MTLSLQTEQKLHLDYILTQPIPVLKNVLSTISSGEVLSLFNDTINDDIKHQAPRALLKLLIDSKQIGLTEKDFNAQVKQLTGATNDKLEALWQHLNENVLLETLLTTDEYKFRDLEWRLESKVASRFLHSHPPDPKAVIKFHLDKETSLDHRVVLSESVQDLTTKKLIVQCNLNNLSHIINQLETARTAINVQKVT